MIKKKIKIKTEKNGLICVRAANQPVKMTPPLPCVTTPLNKLVTTCGARRTVFDFQSRPVGCHPG
jgi:hypothetical protein